MMGPITKPEFPNNDKPPRVDKKTNRGCICTSLPMRERIHFLSNMIFEKRYYLSDNFNRKLL
jgi:hypothetical protein